MPSCLGGDARLCLNMRGYQFVYHVAAKEDKGNSSNQSSKLEGAARQLWQPGRLHATKSISMAALFAAEV